MSVDLGDILPDLGVTTTSNSTGALADPTTLTLTLTLPDGTARIGTYPAAVGDTVTITRASAGTYAATVITTQAGLWSGRWVSVGNTCDGAYEQAWNVEAAGGVFIAVDEASQHLRAAGIITTSADREQLRAYCRFACDAVERDLHRTIAPRTVTDTYSGSSGWSTALTLRRAPLVSVTTVTESGIVLTAGTDFVADLARGVLHRGTTTAARTWAAGRLNIIVVARAGYAVPPLIARKVALNAVERMWQAAQQAPHDALDPDGAVFAAAASLTPVEQSAYKGLRRVVVG